jgi:hypothetical protein
VGSKRQRAMRASHVAASAVIGGLACPASSLRGGASTKKRKSYYDNTSQYSHSMIRRC